MALIKIIALTLGLVLFTQFSVAAPSFTPILPPSYPLAVKNPYLSAWLPGNQAPNLPFAVPQFWSGQNLTWSVMARVDGQTYSLFGVPDPVKGVQPASFMSADYTSTHTTFVVVAGPASIVLDFLSPVSPHDYVRQSLPFTYLTVSVSGINGVTPSVQIYSDIDSSWTGWNDLLFDTEWTIDYTSANAQVFTMIQKGAIEYNESYTSDMAQWGTAVYCTLADSTDITAQFGDISRVHSQFASEGSLSKGGLSNADHRPATKQDVAAFSQDIGKVGGRERPTNVTFAIGYVRDSAINFMNTSRVGYWESTCDNINCASVHALLDFAAADSEARSLDAQIAAKAFANAGGNYSDIVTLSVKQVFGAMDITIPEDTLDTNDVMVFVKEISSDGNVNTIDVIFPTSPILYVMAPQYIRLLLQPVMKFLETGLWPFDYTIHDIGTHYPNATGHNDWAEYMPLEECGDLIIAAYMYQMASGDRDWAKQYSSLFQLYAIYLAQWGLYPGNQLSSDDGAGASGWQTTLAIKSAIALNAYGKMFGQSKYSDLGKYFANVLYNQANGTDPDRSHFTLYQTFNYSGIFGPAYRSWTMAYNLYPDVLLELDTFPNAAYDMQTNFLPNVRTPIAVPLDSAVNWCKTDWMHFCAGVAMAPGVGNKGTRDMFVDDVHALLTNGQNAVPFSDNYYVATNKSRNWIAGNFNTYRARPVVGGHFALMALDGPNQF